MDGLDRATLGVRVKLGQNLPAAVQDEKELVDLAPGAGVVKINY